MATGVIGDRGGRLVVLALGALSFARGQGVWERRADFPIEAFGVSAATVFGQKLYAVCGMTAKGATNSLFIYDPAVDQWTSGPPAPIAGGAQDCNVAASAGKLYVLGAVGGGGAPDGNTYRFDPTEREWRVVGKMPTARTASGVAVAGTKIYVAGGIDEAGRSSAALEVFETETRVWTRLPDMPTARDHLTAKAIRGLVYAIGGRAADAVNTTEEYNPATRSWRARAPMPTARARLASGKSNGRIQVFGGEGACGTASGVCAQNEEYDPATNAWRSLAPLPAPRHSLNGTTIDGRVFTVGGGPWSGASFSGVLEALHLPLSAPPAIARDGIVNAASMQPGVSPGALAALFGERLSQGRQQAPGSPATELNAVTVKLNGRRVPLVYVDSEQINFQAPLDFPVGPAEVTVTNSGVESAKATLSLSQYSPAIFTFAGTGSGQGVVLIAGTGLIAGGRKSAGYRLARRGQVVEIYCTGLGPVKAAAFNRATTTTTPGVTIGGAAAEVLFSGPVTGLAGVYQVNARIPANASTGLAVPLTVRIGPAGAPASNEVTIGIL